MKVTLLMNHKKHILEVDQHTTILEAMLEAELDAPYSCESGMCGTCRGKLLHGDVRMSTHEALTEEELTQGYILTCQATPTTDCEVEITDF